MYEIDEKINKKQLKTMVNQIQCMTTIIGFTKIIVILKYLITFLSNQSILFWTAFLMIYIHLISQKHKNKTQKIKNQIFMFILKDNESLAENDNNNKKDQITIAKI